MSMHDMFCCFKLNCFRFPSHLRLLQRKSVDSYKESKLGKLSPAYDGWKSLNMTGPLLFVSKDFDILIESQ